VRPESVGAFFNQAESSSWAEATVDYKAMIFIPPESFGHSNGSLVRHAALLVMLLWNALF
jgi:hypothetical protein